MTDRDPVELPPLPAAGKSTVPMTTFECVGLLICAVILVGFRLHAFDLPLEPDECNYAYIGQRLLAGDRLYVDVWDHQPYGVFVLFAGVQALFGDDPYVFRWMAVGFSLTSLGLIFLLARRCAGPAAAFTAAGIFALVSSDPGTAGEGCNREIFMNTLILAAWFMGTRPLPSRRGWLLGAGTAMALASALKTIVAVHWLLLVCWLVWRRFRIPKTQGCPGVASAWDIASFGAAPAVLWLASLAYFAGTDRLHEFVDAVFLFNLGYSEGSGSFFSRFPGFFTPPRHPFIFDSAFPLWIGAVAAFVWLIARARKIGTNPAVSLSLLLVASFVAVCLPARFWPHYYYLMIPPLALVVGVATIDLAALMRRRCKPRSIGFVGMTLAVCLPMPCLLAITEYRAYLGAPLYDITVRRYNFRDFWGRAQGRNIEKVTDPGDTIFVFGNDASLYYYARRRCASRYTMLTGLGAGSPGVDARRAVLLAELMKNPPRLIVVLFDEEPWAEWRQFLLENYTEPVGWDLHDRTRKPIMYVFARKDRPIRQLDWDWDHSSVTGRE